MQVDRATQLASLKNHPAWAALVAEVDETAERYTTAVMKVMFLTGKPFDDFEYKRGFLAGLKALVRYPEAATAVLKKDIERQTKEDQT